MSNTPDERPDFFAVLELAPPISVDDVKQAYLSKVKAVHPDLGGKLADFLVLQQAFERAMEYATFRANRMKWLGAQVEYYTEHENTVLQIQELGGQLEIQSIDWMKRSFGEDFSQLMDRIVGIQLRGPRIDDNAIEMLVREKAVLQQLRGLSLIDTKVTDFGALMLRVFQNLERIDLTGSAVTSKVLRIVEWLPQLRWLGVKRTRVGWLSKWKCRLTNRGIKLA